MSDLADKIQLISYLKSHGLYAKHSLGQNFLVDRNVLNKIVEAADLKSEDLIIEVGPGMGVLTEELLKKAGKVIAVELDRKLVQLLNCHIAKLFDFTPVSPCKGAENNNITIQQYNNFELRNADILKLNIPELVQDKPYKVVANIPYYITSKIIQLFLTQENKPETIVLLTQKEVAERICAKPGDMSLLSVSVQAYGKPEIIGIVPKESFFPVPKVDSAILRIKNIHPFNCHFNSTKSVEKSCVQEDLSPLSPFAQGGFEMAQDGKGYGEKEFFRLVHIGFASRRKTLANNIAAGLHIDKQKASGIIKRAGLSESVRAQELSLEQWQGVARIMNQE